MQQQIIFAGCKKQKPYFFEARLLYIDGLVSTEISNISLQY